VGWLLTGRREQDLIDRVVRGDEVGHYYLLIGEKVCFLLGELIDCRGRGRRQCC